MDLQQLRKIAAPTCREFEVRRLSVFGSVARGDDAPDSDIDFLVELDRPEIRPSKRFFGLLHYLEDHLGRPVDLLTANSLRNPYLEQSISRDLVPIYER